MGWLYLMVAIVAEVIATSSLKATEHFTRLWPTLLMAVGYATSFFFLTLTLRTIAVGVAYAVWSGVGIVLITLAARWLYDQRLDLGAWAGIGLIVAGVIVVGLFSDVRVH